MYLKTMYLKTNYSKNMYSKIFLGAALFGSVISSSAQAVSNLVYCSEGSPESFNPQRTLSGTARNATATTIYDRLLDFKKGTTEIIPSLATRWEISEDQKIYTFYLRKGVQFHQTQFFKPSREMTADDVVFSFNRQLMETHPYHQVGGGSYQYFQGMGMHRLIQSVEKVDRYTVRIRLAYPEAPFLANLAMPFMSILSKEYGDQLMRMRQPDQIDQQPIGTGPFAFKRYVKDSLIRFTQHSEHWRGKAKVDQLIFSITPEASVRYQKLKKGECHIAVYPAPADLDSIRKNESMQLIERDGMNIGYLAMNNEKKPFNQPLVRKAIAHALNKASYIQAIYMGNAKPAINPFPESIWSYNKQVHQYPYNPELSKKLLAEAGYPNGFETEIWTLPVTRPFNPNGKKMGELMQHDLAQVGIKVSLKTFDWGTYLDKVKRGEHDIVQLGWTGDNGDPDNFLYTLFSCDSVTRGSNNSRYCQKEFDQLIRQARVESKMSVRVQLYRKAQMIFSQDVPVVPIAHSTVYRAVSHQVEGYEMDPFDMDNFFDLSIRKNQG
ncbi:ABC transporter substrate-binding protein [Algicola sagamiensis]|uniref:ABC transporter substrate-binding protein n=1 Tax=Algicola sagamiensis TaxID=163869 RepID=UPI0003650E39|nr:ABC transporter substrate-binding protein [Algicola sagamiensis]